MIDWLVRRVNLRDLHRALDVAGLVPGHEARHLLGAPKDYHYDYDDCYWYDYDA